MTRILTAAAALAIAGAATGQGSAEQFAGAQYPAPINTFEIEAGHKYDYRPDGQSESYYRVVYRGALVKSEGTPFKQAASLDLAAPLPQTGMGDRSQLEFRYEREKSTLSGGLFEAQGVQPMNIKAFDKLELRGTAFAAGDVHGEAVQFAVGLETAPFRVPGLADTQWSNWIVFGLNGQRQETTDAPTGDATFGVFTYRAFVGKAFGWRKSADVGRTAAKIREEFLKKAPDYATAVKMAAEIRKNTGAGKIPRAPLQQLFLDAVVEAGDQANWEKTVAALAHGRADAITDQPTYAFYAETSGFYTDGKPFGGSKLKNLFTATFDYWFLPARDDVFLRLRYENGFERATPTERKERLLLSVGAKF